MGVPTLYQLSADQVEEIAAAGASGSMHNNSTDTSIYITQALSAPTAVDIKKGPRHELTPKSDRYYESVGGLYKFYALSVVDCDLSVFPKD